MSENYGRHVPLWRRVLGLAPRETWHDRNPLPQGWRPRTKVDSRGREVEPWLFQIQIGRDVHDGGEHWLPVGREVDEAAFEILGFWMDESGSGLEARDVRQTRCAARRAGYGSQVGLAYAAETALTGGL